MQIFVIGCGSISQVHMQNLRALGVKNILAFDQLPERLDEAVRKFGVTPCRSIEEGLTRAPEGVLICTPPRDHVATASLALEAGCHLLIEKPLSDSLDGVDDLLALARAKECMILMGYNLRFHRGMRKVKALLETNTIGRILAIRAEFGYYLPNWRPRQDYRTNYSARADLGGGIILDATHEIDYVRWLAGEVESIACMAGHLSRLEMDVEDVAVLTLRLQGGALADVHLDCVQQDYSRGCRIIGEKGTLTWDFRLKPVEGEYLREGVHLFLSDEKQWKRMAPASDLNEMYQEELLHFLSCVRGETAPEVDGLTGRRILEIALAAKQASDSGREIQVPLKQAVEQDSHTSRVVSVAQPRFVATLACRNRSTRLYGKPLQLLGNETILEHLVHRLQRIKRLDQIVLAISVGEENRVFVEFAKRLDLTYVFGDEKDMQGRLIQAGEKAGAGVLLRVTTECPFPYVENIEDLLEQHLENKADLTVCEGLPEGAYSEIISLAALKRAHAEGEDRHRSEYSTLYLVENPEKFRLLRIQASPPLHRPDIRLTVDYPEDLIVCRALVEALGKGGRYFSLEEIIAYMDAHPKLKEMNGWIDSGQGRIWN